MDLTLWSRVRSDGVTAYGVRTPGGHGSSRPPRLPKPECAEPLLRFLRALSPPRASLPDQRMTSRVVTIGLVCASLYAAALGAGAVAQDESGNGAAPVASVSATQAPETPDATPTTSVTPVETVVDAAPAATESSVPAEDPAPTPADAPADAPAQAPADGSADAPAPAVDPSPAPTAPVPGAGETSPRKRQPRPNRAQGDGG